MQKKSVKKATPKKPKTRKVSENEIHMHAAKWLRDTYPALLAFHVANERNAPVQFHLKLKRMGVLSGVADWLIFPDRGGNVAIELKDDKGVQSSDQEKFQLRWERTRDGVYYLVRTLEEFQNIVTALVLFG